MGQRILLFVLRTSALGLVVAGLAFLACWRLAQELFSGEPNIWSLTLLEFSFRVGATWLAAGLITPILLWSIRSSSGESVSRAEWGSIGGLASLMPAFLGLLALLGVGASSPVVLAWWKSSLELLERLRVWQAFAAGAPESFLAVFPILGVLFIPVVGSATVLFFMAGSTTAFAFRGGGSRLTRVYCAWMVLHAALVGAAFFAGDALREISVPWLEELNALDLEALDTPDAQVPRDAVVYLKDWLPAIVGLARSLTWRAAWISLGYAAWVPVLLAAGTTFEKTRRS